MFNVIYVAVNIKYKYNIINNIRAIMISCGEIVPPVKSVTPDNTAYPVNANTNLNIANHIINNTIFIIIDIKDKNRVLNLH